MQIVEQDGKINFVDETNIFVGFDTYGKCCENFGWCLSTEPLKECPVCDGDDNYKHPEKIDPNDYIFSTNWYRKDNELVVFRLQKSVFKGGWEYIYLNLWNHHNGYYSHNFEFKDNDGGGLDLKDSI